MTSNIGHFNGAFTILNKNLIGEFFFFFFASRYHVCELVLKTEFEAKTKQVTTRLEIPLFKKLEDNLKKHRSH